ncbi:MULTISPECIES: hypothetical protein [Citrobacter]|uniref:hypothetical protein n=1 Tax=Citrobacter TaxID=544 RepID=UPI0014616B25|nr:MULTISPECIES: hypothetical protein [Citrobacter]MBJ9523115.1 hypothetical protein [Citrobacter braakii]NMR47250.1 hypothetical protein [Citrobacter braakii]WFV32820.1 hypothetical protein NFJ30_04035 [Citrobacter braakii]
MKFSEKEDGDITQGVKLVATLDWDTWPECGEMDGKTWKWGDPNIPQLPHHDGCRCVLIPWLKDPVSLGVPVINWKRSRASVVGSVPQEMTWHEWIKIYPSKC